MSEELPEGWDETKLEDTLAFVLGGDWGKSESEKQDDWAKVRVIRGTEFRDWEKGKGATAATRYIKPSSLEKRHLREGDLVIEISGGGPDQPVGRCLLIDQIAISLSPNPLICSNFCRLVRLHAGFDPSYMSYCLRWKYGRGETVRFQNNTVNIRNLDFPRYSSETMVPIPPLAEQRRIVAKVEQILARVNAARERLARAPTIMKRLQQAVLAAACSGKLTVEWRKEAGSQQAANQWVASVVRSRQEIAGGRKLLKPCSEQVEAQSIGALEGWCVTPLGNITECLDTLRVPVRKDLRGEAGSVPYYGANGQTGWIDRHLFDEDLVLVVEDETFVGRELPFSYVIRGKSWVNNHAHVLRPLGGMSADYLNIVLSYYDFVPLTSGTTGRRKLNQAALLAAPIPVAPLREQEEIIRREQALSTLVKSIGQSVAAAIARADKLTQAVLARAFRGELVPTEAELARAEGRDYEPASALLERVRAERAATPKLGRRRK